MARRLDPGVALGENSLPLRLRQPSLVHHRRDDDDGTAIVDPRPTTRPTRPLPKPLPRKIPIDNNRPCGPPGFLPGGLSDAGPSARG
jgi:hypothetical protein